MNNSPPQPEPALEVDPFDSFDAFTPASRYAARPRLGRFLDLGEPLSHRGFAAPPWGRVLLLDLGRRQRAQHYWHSQV